VEVTESDRIRMGQRATEATTVVDGGLYLKMKDGHCAQLEHLDGNWICGMYSARPNACRQLERGSPPCLAERELKLVRTRRLSRRLAAQTLKK